MNLFQLLYSTVGRLHGRVYSGNLHSETIVSRGDSSTNYGETFRVTSVLFIGGYLATQINSTDVESERYSDYFNPVPDISNDTF